MKVNWATWADWLVAICVAATIFFIVALAAFAAYADIITVHDGDSIQFNGETIRLYGVDAPELEQPGGVEARDWLMEKITGYPLRISRRGKDHYGRQIAIIFVGNTSVNKALVLEGHAWAYREHAALYVSSERIARTAQRGLWHPGLLSAGSTCPQAPWHWREDHR